MTIFLWIFGVTAFLFALLFVAAEMNMPTPPEHGLIVNILITPFYFIVIGLFLLIGFTMNIIKKRRK